MTAPIVVLHRIATDPTGRDAVLTQLEAKWLVAHIKSLEAAVLTAELPVARATVPNRPRRPALRVVSDHYGHELPPEPDPSGGAA